MPSGPCSDLPLRALLHVYHPGHQRLQFPSINGTGWGYSLSLLPLLQLARLVHSLWLAHLFGMGFHWHCDFSPGFTPTHSTLALKPGMLILVLVPKDSLRTFFKSLSLSWPLGVRSLSWSLEVGSLSLSWSLWVRSLWSSPCPCF